MLIYAGLIVNVGFVLAAAWAAAKHFKRDVTVEREPLGAKLITIATIVGTAINIWFCINEPRASGSLALISIGMTALASLIFARAIAATHKRGLGVAFTEQTPPEVVDDGIYGLIRHPFYTSYLLYWASWIALTNVDIFPIAFAAGMLVFYIIAMGKEEALLSERLGEPYRNLMSRTARLIPWIY